MTTFGGRTVPPLFGGDAPLGFELRDAGPVTLFLRLDGHPDTAIVLPDRKVDDILIAYWAQDPGGMPNVPGWTMMIPTQSNNNLFTRQATNDANDAFIIPATQTDAIFAQVASFNNPLANGVTSVSSSTTRTGNRVDWILTSLAASALLDTLIISRVWRLSVGGGVGLTETDNLIAEGFQTVGKGGDGSGSRNFHGMWSWRNDPDAGLIVPLVDQGYAPVLSQFMFSHTIRFQQTP